MDTVIKNYMISRGFDSIMSCKDGVFEGHIKIKINDSIKYTDELLMFPCPNTIGESYTNIELAEKDDRVKSIANRQGQICVLFDSGVKEDFIIDIKCYKSAYGTESTLVRYRGSVGRNDKRPQPGYAGDNFY